MKSTDQTFRGFLISCDKNREKDAVKDAYNFLEEYIQKIYSDVTEETITKKIKKDGKQLSLQNEIKYSKGANNRLLSQVQTNVNCLCFIKINPVYKQIDPLVIVSDIMKDVHDEGRFVTRYCHRILPVERAFRAEHFRMIQEVDQLLYTHSADKQIRSWMLNFKCRNNNKFNYKEILKEMQTLCKKYNHFPDIYYPQWTISIEVLNHLMCVSICERFKETNQYKLHKAASKEEIKEKGNNKKEEEGPKDAKTFKKKQNDKQEIKVQEKAEQQGAKVTQNKEQDVVLHHQKIEQKQDDVDLF